VSGSIRPRPRASTDVCEQCSAVSAVVSAGLVHQASLAGHALPVHESARQHLASGGYAAVARPTELRTWPVLVGTCVQMLAMITEAWDVESSGLDGIVQTENKNNNRRFIGYHRFHRYQIDPFKRAIFERKYAQALLDHTSQKRRDLGS